MTSGWSPKWLVDHGRIWQKSTIILVSGAFHTPESYQKLTNALKSYGYDIHVPRLPTCNDIRPPNADLLSDTEFVRNYVETLIGDGRTVVAIGHFYGGQVLSNALTGLGIEARSSKGLTGGKGKSTSDQFREFGDAANAPLVFDMAENGSMVLRDPNLSFGLNTPGQEIPKDEVAAYHETLCRWNGKTMFQPLENEACISTPEEESMAKTLRQTGRVVKTAAIESGHCPHFSATRAVADAIDEMIRGWVVQCAELQ
ncbi:alpha/beta-hydrolase [Xylariaceae sp. FL1272]|nr:alpha/beta-hydrolase [Xylariaceae sp. FL1272]